MAKSAVIGPNRGISMNLYESMAAMIEIMRDSVVVSIEIVSDIGRQA